MPDPYRWLEEDSPEVKTWVAAQNRHTRRVLDGLHQRAAIRDRLLPLLRATTTSSPQVAGDRVFTVDRGGDRDQSVLCVRSATEQRPAHVVVDPATISDDPTAALDWYHASPDGGLMRTACPRAATSRARCVWSTS